MYQIHLCKNEKVTDEPKHKVVCLRKEVDDANEIILAVFLDEFRVNDEKFSEETLSKMDCEKIYAWDANQIKQMSVRMPGIGFKKEWEESGAPIVMIYPDIKKIAPNLNLTNQWISENDGAQELGMPKSWMKCESQFGNVKTEYKSYSDCIIVTEKDAATDVIARKSYYAFQVGLVLTEAFKGGKLAVREVLIDKR